ncbi:MAG: ABC transporter ATP-binding protein, partial [Clostridiales bacterium]|nr:ABC transporter ATP-binding protein [Clostridiales bacterium]
RVQMRTVIKKLQRRLGITTIYVTHDQEEALAISDRIAVMKDGVIMQVGTPDEVYKRPNNPFVAGFIGISNFIDCRIEGENPEDARLLIDEGRTVVPARLRKPYSGEGRISARPEQLRFADEGIPGTIELSTFLGDFIEYEVKLRDGQTVQLNEYTKDVGDIKPDGRQVFVNFDPARISIYAGESEVLSC